MTSLAAKKRRLAALLPLSQAALLALQKSLDVELTYTSSAMEGNTLTLRETAELIEHGITVGGKPLHFRLAAIHPFSDGNGRAARLLMNLLLLRAGYPPISIRPEDRKIYLDTLEHASLTNDLAPFYTFLEQRLDATLEQYLKLLESSD